MFQADERAALYGPASAALAGVAEAALARHFDRFAALPHDSRMMRFDFETYLPEDVLTKVDRMSMAHSIETRVPLLDNLVIDFAATLPARLKIKNGRRKHILKETLRPMLPAGILDRKKQGFGIPLGTWFRGGLTGLFSDVLDAPRTRQRGYFEPAFVVAPAEGAPGRRAGSHAPPLAAAGLRAVAPPVPRYGRGRRVGCPRQVAAFPLFLTLMPQLRGTSLAQVAGCDVGSTNSGRRFPNRVPSGRNGTADDRAHPAARPDALRRARRLLPARGRLAAARRGVRAGDGVSDPRLRPVPATLVRAAAFAQWCRARRIAVLQACDFYANTFALPAAALAGVPVRIGSRRELNPDKSAGQIALQRQAYRFAHAIVGELPRRRGASSSLKASPRTAFGSSRTA